MNNIQPFALYIENLLKTAGIHPLIQKRLLRKARSPLRQPQEDFQAMRERSFQDIEKEEAVPTWLDIIRHHLENFANIKSP